MATNWYKQTAGQPAFPNLLWSKPQNRQIAGRLLIVGGQANSFSAPSQAYQAAKSAGIGQICLILPESLKKIVGNHLEGVYFGPSNPSGSLAEKALAEIVDQSATNDILLLAGDLGKNSQTSVLIEKMINSIIIPMVLTKESVAIYLGLNNINHPDKISLVLGLGQLQKLLNNRQWPKSIILSTPLPAVIEILSQFSHKHREILCVLINNNLLLSVNGRVSQTELQKFSENWMTNLGAYLATWLAQFPMQPFEAINCAVYEYQNY